MLGLSSTLDPKTIHSGSLKALGILWAQVSWVITPIMENQMEKKWKNEWKLGVGRDL